MEQQLFQYLSKYITLTEEEANELISMDLIRAIPKGSILLREGERSIRSYFVLKGCLRSYYLIDGEEKTTAFYTENQGVTPQCVTTQEPSAYFLVCVEDCVLATSTSDMEAPFFEKFPRFESLCRVLGEKMLTNQQMSFDAYMNSTPEQRYLLLLENRPDLIQRVPQYQLASYLGIKPESLSRIRKRLLEKKRSA
ncbi:MAG: Crp/Fnr family transcriptional regulator [Bacteroidota bacterium]